MTERIPCCVPFCRRTFKDDGRAGEIMCGKHYRLADQRYRRLWTRLVRAWRRDPRQFWEMPPGSRERLRKLKIERLFDKLWVRIKRQAIERAAGITG